MVKIHNVWHKVTAWTCLLVLRQSETRFPQDESQEHTKKTVGPLGSALELIPDLF